MTFLMEASAATLDDLLARMQRGASRLGLAVAQPVASIRVPAALPSPLPGKEGWLQRLMLMVEGRFGIHPSAQVERKLGRIFECLSDTDLRDWVMQLDGLPPEHSEWLSLVENLTVHETYFCRDKPLLAMLATDVLPQLIAEKVAARDFSLRFWSAGCSTGEETYDLAMLTLEALLAAGEATVLGAGAIYPDSRWRVSILGTDISRQVLRTAESAVYPDIGMGSFRSMSQGKDVYFERVANAGDGVEGVVYKEVRPFVRKWVQFRQHNLLTAAPPDGGFDCVLCRNVMIYFEEAAKRQAQDLLHRGLRPGGVLALGGTDVQYWPERYLRQSGEGGTWYLRK